MTSHSTTIVLEILLDGQATALTQKAIDVALTVDIPALRLCLDRTLPLRKNSPVAFDLPEIKTLKVTIITVTEPPPVPSIAASGWGMAGMDQDRLEDADTQHAKAILSAVKSAAEEMGVSVETLHVPNASPAAAIVDAAKTHGCDLIIIASHGRRGIKRAFLGSRTAEVLATADIPVLVVH